MELKNFAIISGSSVKITDGKINYTAIKGAKKEETELVETDTYKDEDLDLVLLRSDASFNSGTLELSVKVKSFETGILVKFASFDNKEIRCGYSRTYKQFIIAINEGRKWQTLSSAGKLSDYTLNEEIKFRIEVNGSQISLSINNILLCSANTPIKDNPIEIQVASDNNVEIFKIQKHSTKPKIFVVMQFSNEYNELFEEVIKPVTEKHGFECVRADEYYTGTPILVDIIKSIQDSTAIIAEITPDNPNVFYEIGYSHAIGKPTILLCDKKREKLPFDLSGFRTLFYENTIAGKKKVENSLTKYLENI